MENGIQRIPICSDADIVRARLCVRALAERMGFAGHDVVLMVTAVSEIARTIMERSTQGEISVSPKDLGTRRGLEVIARDEGPGIPDVARAMQAGYSTSMGLGLGLPGARRLVDEFEIVSQVGSGTKVTMRKWLR